MKKFHHIWASISLLPLSDGGRSSFIIRGYRPRIYFNEGSSDCSFFLPEDAIIYPGESTETEIAILCTEYFEIEIKSGMGFEIKEGKRVVGKGTVKEVLGIK